MKLVAFAIMFVHVQCWLSFYFVSYSSTLELKLPCDTNHTLIKALVS